MKRKIIEYLIALMYIVALPLILIEIKGESGPVTAMTAYLMGALIAMNIHHSFELGNDIKRAYELMSILYRKL